MEDKTAAIPSLKDFKDRQKDRSAQSERTGSMQTKGQLRRNAQNTKKAPPRTSSSPRRSASQDTMRIDTRKVRSSSSAGKKQTNSKKTGSPPKTYARERMSQRSNSDYDNSRRIDRAPQTERRSGARSATPSAQRTQSQRQPSQKTQSQRPQAKRPQPPRPPHKKKKKPIILN